MVQTVDKAKAESGRGTQQPTPTIKLDIRFGSIELPKPTGRWNRDPDGGWWEECTPTRWLDRDGNVEREKPYEPIVRVFGDDETMRHAILMTGGRIP